MICSLLGSKEFLFIFVIDIELDEYYTGGVNDKITPSAYQREVFKFVESGSGHALVEAVAGSGKTTTILEALDRVPKCIDVLFCAFNKHIAEELSMRAPVGVTVSTIHSLGFRTLLSRISRDIQVEPRKTQKIVKNMHTSEVEDISVAIELANLCKLTLTPWKDLSAIADIADRYDVVAYPSQKLLRFVSRILENSIDDVETIDYSDMVWLPNVLGLRPVRQFGVVFVDEAQDLNAAQRELVVSAVAPRGRVIAVGDSRQAIYGFSGADVESMNTLESRLSATRLPLSICYRCPRSHVELAKKYVPEIEAAPDAEEGVIRDVSLEEVISQTRPGDLVICRLNRPIVKLAMEMLSAGKKAIVRGRDISASLVRLAKKIAQKSDGTISSWIRESCEYFSIEFERLCDAGKQDAAELLRDKIDALKVLCEGLHSVSELIERVEKIFSDENGSGITLSTIHKAKGLQADRVIVLDPELMPLRWARPGWQQEQERNLQYISVTRAKRELWYLRGYE